MKRRTLPLYAPDEPPGSPPTPPVEPPAPPAQPPTPPAEPPIPPPPPTAKDEKRIAAEAAKKAREDMLTELGVTSVDDLKATVKARQEAEDAEKSEAQKAREAADRETAAAKQERAEAAAEKLAARVEIALARAGVKPERLEKAGRLVDVEAGADTEAVTAAVESFKAETPEWFGAPSTPAPPGVPGQQPPATQPGDKVGVEAGRDLARQQREARLAKNPPLGGLRPLGAPMSTNAN